MNKKAKSLIVLFLAFFIGSYFSIDFVRAQNDELVLEITKECDIQYTGDSCVTELKLTNNSGETLDGEAFLHVDYQGVCGDGFFDGEGIEARFSIDDTNWLDFSNWNNGTAIVSGFEIAKDETQPKLKIETASNLCPGNYTFILTINGTAETGEEHTTLPVTLGSGGGGLPLGLTIQYENSQVATTTATITWLTSYKSTSRVIYDTVPDKFDLRAGEPKYGYAFATAEFDTPANLNGVTGHSITIYNLTENTEYWFRCVSHASPPAIGREHSFTTLAMGDTIAEGDVGDNGAGDTDGADDGADDDGGDVSGYTGDGDESGDKGDTGDTDAEGDGAGVGTEPSTPSHSEGVSPTGGTAEESPGTGDVGEDDFEYGDHIWEHQGDDDQLSVINDQSSDNDQSADEADLKFLAGIGTFFSGLEGWRLALIFLLGIILALIILRLIRTRIDRKK